MSEKTTIYVVTDGEYSDYRIVGIFSTKEKAEEAADLLRAENPIEGWNLDELPPRPEGMLSFCVRMTKGGEAISIKRKSIAEPPRREWVPCGDNRTVRFEMWAKDEAHAVKIANERRVQLIASGEWTTDWHEWKERVFARQ